MRIVVGVSGASGAVYGLELLRRLHELGHEVHAVVSPYGYHVLSHECGVGKKDITPLVHALYEHVDMAAPIASGSFRAEAMAVVPCSMRTLAAIAGGLAGDLLCRAADVMIKERKNLVLAVRETPLNALHLENMLKLARTGVGIMPLCPGFYHKPESLHELVDMMVGRILDNLGVDNAVCSRWNGMSAPIDAGVAT